MTFPDDIDFLILFNLKEGVFMTIKPDEKNNLNKLEFLYNAINDIAGNIRYIDTKIALILASLGVIVGIVLTCREDLCFAYGNLGKLRIYFLFSIIIFAVCALFTAIFSLVCLIPRHYENEEELKKTFWHFNPIADYKNFKNFYREFNDCLNIESEVCKEVYKLNIINNKKYFWSKRATILFCITCLSTIFFTTISCYYYLILN